MSERAPRSSAEWTTFAVSSVIVLGVLVAIVFQGIRSDDPAAPIAAIDGAIERLEGRFHVPVTVTNEGDATAEAVQVVVTLEAGGETVEAEQVVDFLAGDDEAELVFVFADDPADGELDVRVAGFTVP